MDNQSESEFPLTRAEYQRQIRRGNNQNGGNGLYALQIDDGTVLAHYKFCEYVERTQQVAEIGCRDLVAKDHLKVIARAAETKRMGQGAAAAAEERARNISRGATLPLDNRRRDGEIYIQPLFASAEYARLAKQRGALLVYAGKYQLVPAGNVRTRIETAYFKAAALYGFGKKFGSTLTLGAQFKAVVARRFDKAAARAYKARKGGKFLRPATRKVFYYLVFNLFCKICHNLLRP